jgi:general L-amino acid transport system substrate-binding protein
MKTNILKFFGSLALLFAFVISSVTANAGTKDDVTKKGILNCGVSQGVPGFSNADASGKWTGIDVDMCRAVAAAVFGDANKVKYQPLSAKDRFEVLKSGEIDMLARNTTWTLSRDAGLALEFVGTNFYDGQGFIVRKAAKINSAKKLNNVKVCVETGTTTELNLRDYFKANNLKYEAVAFTKADEAVAAYDAGRCDVYTTDKSGLAAQRTKMKNPAEHTVLPETISKEPLGPVVRGDDQNWKDIASWSLYVMIEAEELGVSSKNIDSLKSTDNPNIKRLLGLEGDTGKSLGLAPEWAYNIIKQVGNYGEVYEANVGANTPIGLARSGSPNQLWTKGGILYAPPVR